KMLEKETNKDNSLKRRWKTAFIAIPILVSFLYNKFLYFVLMLSNSLLILVVNHIIYSEYHVISENIMKVLFTEDDSKVTFNVFISYPLTKFIFMLCPIIMYIIPNGT